MEVLRAFDRQHRATFEGAKYLATFKRDRPIARDLIRGYGLPRVLEMVEAFFGESRRFRRGDQDAYIGKAKPDFTGFRKQVPNLIARFEFDSAVVGGETT